MPKFLLPIHTNFFGIGFEHQGLNKDFALAINLMVDVDMVVIRHAADWYFSSMFIVD